MNGAAAGRVAAPRFLPRALVFISKMLAHPRRPRAPRPRRNGEDDDECGDDSQCDPNHLYVHGQVSGQWRRKGVARIAICRACLVGRLGCRVASCRVAKKRSRLLATWSPGNPVTWQPGTGHRAPGTGHRAPGTESHMHPRLPHADDRMIDECARDLAGHERRTEVEALRLVALAALEKGVLILGLDAFGDHAE